MKKFKLHSRGKNWFHFRQNLDSICESFSITYCHDSTVCMTGDYGTLCWRRQFKFAPFPPDYGFPNKKTSIDYFAEKVVRAEETQIIKTWDRGLAKIQIGALFDDYLIEGYQSDGDKEYKEKLQYVYNELDHLEDGNHGYIQMLESFSDGGCIESEFYSELGRTYTKTFKMHFEMLQSVSDLIFKAIENDEKNYIELKVR